MEKLTLTKIKETKNILIEYSEAISLTFLYSLSILIPFIIKHPQLLVGILINSVIVFTVLKFGFKKSLPTLILPSLSAYLHGVLFGSATIFLLYFVPFIILSNIIFSFLISKIKNTYIGYISGCILKSIFLFTIAYIFVNKIGVPEIFLKTMGINQLITALIGGGISVISFKILNRNI